MDKLLEALGWRKEDLPAMLEEAEKREREGMAKREGMAEYARRLYDPQRHPNVVVFDSGYSGGTLVERASLHQACNDEAAFLRMERTIQPFKEVSFDTLLPQNEQGGKQDSSSIHQDYKRRRARYRGSAITRQTPQQVCLYSRINESLGLTPSLGGPQHL